MKPEKYPFFNKIKIRLAFIIALIVSIILCLAYLSYMTSKNNYHEKVLLDILGRQRMYTQLIAKDASRLYILIQALGLEDKLESDEEINSKIRFVKSDILKAKNEFSAVLDQIQNGVILSGKSSIPFDSSHPEIRGELNNILAIWSNFSKSVDTLYHSNSLDSAFKYAAIYINENNEPLLGSCDKILAAGIETTRQKARTNTLAAGFIAAVAFITLGGSVYNIYKYFINPLSEIYKVFPEVGITSQYLKQAMLTKNDVRPILDEIGNMFRKLDMLFSLIENINNNQSFREVLEYIFKSFSPFIPYNYIGVALLKNNETCLEASYGLSDGTIRDLPEALFNKEYTVAETSLNIVLDTGNVRVINDLETYTISRPVKEYTEIIMNSGIKSSITLPLKINNKHIGLIFFSSRHANVYTEEHVKFLKAIANSIAICFNKNIFMDDLLYSSLLALTKLAEARDEDTGYHLERMKLYSRTLAQCLYSSGKYKSRITPEFINDMEKFSPMHDIGKVGVRDGILLKPGKLTFEEFEEMKKHTVFGAEVLRTAEKHIENSGRSIFKMGIEIAECHHEKWDGSGYPFGKSGEAIPLSARIVAVADVFDALTSKRPYKEPFSFEKSFAIILEGAGKHFDPEIARVFEENRQLIHDLYLKFSTQE